VRSGIPTFTYSVLSAASVVNPMSVPGARRAAGGSYLTMRPIRLKRMAHGEMMIRAMFGAASDEK
jgi:hypothetical protein